MSKDTQVDANLEPMSDRTLQIVRRLVEDGESIPNHGARRLLRRLEIAEVRASQAKPAAGAVATPAGVETLLTKLWFVAERLEPTVREEVAGIIVALRSALISPVAPEGEEPVAWRLHGDYGWSLTWDQSNLPWSESHHKDDVLAALFRGP